VAYGCSLAILTPISHPANVLVMGPGGYRFSDYVRVVLVLTVSLMALIVELIALLWGV